ncbi:M3 family metallopeptidase, partial [Vibrio breoganii]
HFETGEALPKEMLEKMLAAKNFQSAMFILRQLELGLFDFTLHTEYDPEVGARVLETLADVKSKVSVLPSLDWNRFSHSFGHIFAGGY